MLQRSIWRAVRYDDWTGEGVAFAHPVDEEGEHRAVNTIVISEQDYRDFGSPDELTVSILPGDHLNVKDETEMTKPMLTLVEIIPSAGGGWYVRGMAANAETLWHSESYTTVAAAREHAYSYGVQVKEELDG